MKSDALQGLIKAIFGEEKTRKEFMANPGSVIARFGLTEEEKRAVLSTQSRLGLVTSGSPELAAVLRATDAWTA